MPGPDDEQAGEPAAEVLERIAETGGLERRELLPGAAAEIGAAGAELVRAGRRRGGSDQNHLFGARNPDFLEQPGDSAGAIAEAMRFTAPGPFGGKRGQVRLGGDRQREGGRQRVERVVARHPAQIERLQGSPGALRRAGPPEKPRAVRGR